MKDLKPWLSTMEEVAGPGSGIFMTSIYDGNKRIQIGMRPLPGALQQTAAAMAAAGVPREAVVNEMGCNADGPGRLHKGKSPDRALLTAIRYSLEAPSQVAYGKTVYMKLTLRNISDEPAHFCMGGIRADGFVVATADGGNIGH